MPYFLEVPLDNGEVVLARLSGHNGEVVPFGRRESAEKLAGSLTGQLGKVRAFAAEVLGTLKDSVEPPERVAIEFGLELSGTTGLVIAETSAAAHLTVTMEWSRQKQSDSSHPDGS